MIKDGIIAPGTSADPLSGGRTNSLWRVTLPAGGKAVLKCFAGADENPLFPNRAGAETAALAALSGEEIAPELIASGRHQGRDWILLSYIEAQPHWLGPTDVAALLARIHLRPAWSGLRLAPNGSVAIARHTRDILALCTTQEAQAVAIHQPATDVPPLATLCPIHADPVPTNLLQGVDGPAAVDWQCPALGDPVEDLATYLSPAMQIIYAGAPLPEDQIAACLAAYPNRDTVARYHQLAPWFHWRIAAYCAWQAARGEAVYRTALPAQLAAI